MRRSFGSAATALAILAAPPAAAADLYDASPAGQRTSAFAGATFRLALDSPRAEPTRPRLAIGVSRVHERLDSSGRVERMAMPALELAPRRNGPLQWLVAGQSMTEGRQRLGLTTTHFVLIGVGLAAAVFAVVELSDEQDCPLPEGGC